MSPTAPQTVFADNWGIPAFIIIYFLLWFSIAVSTYKRRHFQPLKSSGHWTMQFSALSLMILSLCLTEEAFYAQTLSSTAFCTLWQWAASFFYCGCVVPYFLRTHRLRFLHSKTREFVALESKSKRFRYQRHYKYWMQENRLLLLAVVLCLMSFAGRFLVDEMTSNYHYHLISIGCDDSSANLDFASVVWIGIHCAESLGLLWCVSKLKAIKQSFNIVRELYWGAFVWVLATVCSTVVFLYGVVEPFRSSFISEFYNCE